MDVIKSKITNYSAINEIGVPIQVSIGYDIPIKKVRDLLKEAAINTEEILSKPKPIVLVNELGNNYILYELNVFTENDHAMLQLASNLRENTNSMFTKNNIKILSPIHVNIGHSLKEDNTQIQSLESKTEQAEISDEKDVEKELGEVKKEILKKKEE